MKLAARVKADYGYQTWVFDSSETFDNVLRNTHISDISVIDFSIVSAFYPVERCSRCNQQLQLGHSKCLNRECILAEIEEEEAKLQEPTE